MGIETSNTRKPLGLIRGLGVWASTAIVIGAMIGQSVFLVASDMSREVSSMWKVLVVWIIGGVIFLFGAFCCRIGRRTPRVGGDYICLGRGIGPLWGFLFGWSFSLDLGFRTQWRVMETSLALQSGFNANFIRPAVLWFSKAVWQFYWC